MKAAEEFQEVAPGLFFWETYDPSVKADLSCSALITAAGLVFIDPIPLADEALNVLAALSLPVAVVLTNANHERASAHYSSRFGVPVFAHEEARGEVSADESVREGPLAAAAIDVISLPGFGAGEVALASGDVLIVGDSLINLEPHGFSLLPEKYCADQKLGRESLRKLLQRRFEVLTFAHGAPLVRNPRARLEALLA